MWKDEVLRKRSKKLQDYLDGNENKYKHNLKKKWKSVYNPCIIEQHSWAQMRSQDLLRSHKICWGLTRSIPVTKVSNGMVSVLVNNTGLRDASASKNINTNANSKI